MLKISKWRIRGTINGKIWYSKPMSAAKALHDEQVLSEYFDVKLERA